MIKSIASVKVTGKRVIVRAGFDVPLKQNKSGAWVAADDNRIKATFDTLHYLIKQKAKIVIMSHLGRPEGWEMDKSQWPVAERLGELMNMKVVKVKDRLPAYDVPHIYFLESNILKKDYAQLSVQLKPGDILFLENLRFYPGEKEDDGKFAATLAEFGDVYVQAAFSNAHRKDASMYALAQKLPHYAGISFLREIQSLTKIIHNPDKPLIVIMGGAKIDDKVETLHNLARHASKIVLGGAIATTFQKAIGYDVGKSRVSDVKLAKQIWRQYREKIFLPVDVVVADTLEGRPRSCKIEQVRPNESIFDCGPETIREIAKIIKTGKTLVWNGPFGVFENPHFAFGSKAIAQAFAMQSKGKAFGVVGGGETAELVDQAKLVQFIDHVSTGGGAMLEFLAGKSLPAIKVLEK